MAEKLGLSLGMIAFDVPERAVCSTRRLRTNTPIQALVTLNDPVFVEAAQALARRILTDGGPTVESRAAFGVRIVLSRPPAETESRRLVALYHSARSSVAANPLAGRGRTCHETAGPAPPGDGHPRRRSVDGRRQCAIEPRRNPRETLNEAGSNPMKPIHSLDRLADRTRRHFLREGSLGLGGLALKRIYRGRRPRAGAVARRSTTHSVPGAAALPGQGEECGSS